MLSRVLEIEGLNATPVAEEKSSRKILSVSMQKALFEEIAAYCKEEDIPVSVFARKALREKLGRARL